MMKLDELLRHALGYLVGFSLFAVLMPYGIYLLAWRYPAGVAGFDAGIRVLGWPLLAVGAFFILWSNKDLLLVGRGGPADGFNVAVSPRTKRLVTTGPYRYTRNPMVFGALACYYAEAILLDSVVCLAAVVAFNLAARIYIRLTEEKRLERDFGGEYLEYKKTVPMIMPRLAAKRRETH
ncbi:MAG: isoprenylcysteine carboxylmethyltransferase family protein [Endomicrobiales bacterium]|nr:isoprenylcysteine carboxylmethyltransferase family protein [Endomicrobiales bacterium]